MTGIKYYSEPKVNNPVMLVSWPGMGIVASQAVEYLKKQLQVELFAEIETDDFIVPNSVRVSDGIANFPVLPRILFYYCKEYDIILCKAEEQFSGSYARQIMERFFSIAVKAGVRRIYSGAAFVQHMSYSEPSEVYIVANTGKLLEELIGEEKLILLTQGQISGLNGTVLGFAGKYNIDAACFLATIPVYAVNFPNPKASRAIIEIWETLTGFSFDYNDIDHAVTESDRALAVVEEQIKKITLKDDIPFKSVEEPEIRINSPETPEEVPGYVFREIEELFGKAEKDRSVVNKLKEELDRWKLFSRYEDRFLDLFKDI